MGKCVLVVLVMLNGLLSNVSGTARLDLGVTISVSEGEEIQPCVSLNPPATVDTDVTVSTSVTTATGGADFTALTEVMTFSVGEARRCTASNISVLTDNIVESVEIFSIRISSNDVPIDTISNFGTTVNINDRSRITIAFSDVEYTTPNEIDTFREVCATITDGEIDRDVEFSITSIPGGTATTLDDFTVITGLPPTFSPNPATNNPCIQINLEDDTLVEENEYLVVQLSGGNEAINVPANLTARVTITDDDGATVQLSRSALSIQEGDSGTNTTAPLCLTLTGAKGGLRRDVVVNLSTQDRIAMVSDNDYYPIQNQQLTIPLTTSVGGEVCASIIIIGDDIMEPNELFQVLITAVNANDVVPTVFRITIADDGDVKVSCPDLTDPLNGEVIVNDVNNVEGSIASYSCDFSYNLIGNAMRTCENVGSSLSGEWSGSTPVCQIIDCGPPPMPPNSMVEAPVTTLGNTAVYTCNSGYELSTGTLTVTRQCMANSEWSEVTPSCITVDCGSPPETVNGQVSSMTTTFQSTATYTCDTGYEFASRDEQITRMCQADGSWSDSTPQCHSVDCGPPPIIINGSPSVPATTFQSTANYTCDMGYQFPSGAQVMAILCQADMMWSGPLPQCQPVDCGAPPNTTNGQVNVLSTTFNSEATYQCDLGFRFSSGESQITRMCRSDRTWSGSTPSCNPVECGQPPALTNGRFSAPATTFQSVATYVCVRGYEISPEDATTTRMCQADGVWSSPTNAPTCQLITCEELNAPENGTVSLPAERTVDSIATYSCIEGYDLLGVANVTCQPNGTWSAGEPNCIVLCNQLNLPNGNILLTNENREGSVATHTCNPQLILVGDMIRTCQPDGTWSGSGASCNPAPPSTQGLSNRQDDVIIGASVAAGIALFIIIIVVGVLCLGCIVIRKKKVYKKYVLPYRTYMYANSLRNHPEGIIRDSEIRDWENENHTHALAAVEALNK